MSKPFAKLCWISLMAASQVALAQQYSISTVAGGAPPPTPAAAASTSIGQPNRVMVDASGNVYFSSLNCVFKMDGSGNLVRQLHPSNREAGDTEQVSNGSLG